MYVIGTFSYRERERLGYRQPVGSQLQMASIGTKICGQKVSLSR